MFQGVSKIDLSAIEKDLSAHPFVVPKYLQNYHVQSLLARLFPYYKTTLPKKERKYITLTDGSKIAVDFIFQPNRETCPSIIILDGFTRSNNSHFSQSMCNKVYHFGFNVALLMQRAEGDTLHLTESLFSAYPQFDLPIAFEEFSKIGLNKVYLVGFSGGGWSTLLTLGLMGRDVRKYLSGAVVISTAVSLISLWEHIEKNPIYNWYLLHTYKKIVKRRITVDAPGTWNTKGIRKIKTKRHFFENYFSTHTIGTPKKKVTVEEYDQKTDSISLLPNVQIPTLIINSYDDPVVPVSPFLSITNPNIITLLPKHGGHGGFFTTKKLYGDLDGLWAQNRAMEFIRFLDER